MHPKTLAIIPARGGSKGLPGKNIRPLYGKPLIAWTIEQALQSGAFATVAVSTDSKEIATVASSYGADVPFIRPADLATDTATSMNVVLHALDFYAEQEQNFDYVALLEPTSPLRKQGQLKAMIDTLIAANAADALVSVGEVHMEHPHIVKRVNEQGYLTSFANGPKQATRRQELSKALFPYGVIYAIKVDSLRREKTFYPDKTLPFFIERWQNYEIDDFWDFVCIEAIFEKQKGMFV